MNPRWAAVAPWCCEIALPASVLAVLVALGFASGETNKVPAFGTCCQTVNVTVPSTAITAGTQYWIGVTSDDTQAPGFTGVFESTNSSTIAYNPSLDGWFTFSGNVPAILVRGTLP